MATSPGGKSVGRVSIRVIPDTSKFREDLRKVLTRVEKTMQADLAMVLTDESKARFKRDVDKVIRDANGKNANIDIRANTRLAKLEIAAAARRRDATIGVKVDKTSLAAAKVLLDSLARVSGARAAGTWAKDFLENVANLDKALPKMSLIATGIGSLVSVLLASISGLTGIGAGLAAIMPSLLILPGLFAGSVLSLGVLVVALADAKRQLAALSPSISELKQVIQTDFWDQARKPIVDLVRNLMPQLRVSFSETSKAIGGFVGSLAGSFAKSFAGGRFQNIFAGIPATFRILSSGTDAFAGAISNLGLVAAKYVPRLAQWFVDISFHFDKFLSDASTDGRLDSWMERAVKATKDLGRSFKNIGRIFAATWDAAERAGGGGLRGFADNLGRIAKTAESPRFQTALTTIFRGAQRATAGINVGLSALGSLLYDLRGNVADILASSGQILGSFIADIADALDTPAVATGLTNLVAGITQGFADFGKALPGLSSTLGDLLSAAGQLARELGPVLGAALGTLGSTLQPLIDTVKNDLLPKLGPDLVKALDNLKKPMHSLAESVGKLADKLGGIGDIITSPTGLGVLDTFVQGVTDKINSLTLLLSPENWAAQFNFGNLFFGGLASLIDPAGIGYGKQLANAIQQGFNSVDWNDWWTNSVQRNWGHGWQQITDFTTAALNGISFATNQWMVQWARTWSLIGTLAIAGLKALPGQIQGALAGAGTWLVGIGANIVNGLITGISSAVPALLARLAGLAAQIIAKLKKDLGIASPSKVMRYQIGQFLVLGMAKGIDDKAALVSERLAAAVLPAGATMPDFSDIASRLALAARGGDTFNAHFALAPQPGIPIADQAFQAAARLKARQRRG